MLPLAIYHTSHFLAKQYGVLAYKHIRAGLNCLDMLGIAIERDARHGIERCLFSHVARIGNNAESMGCEIAELKIAERTNDV